MKNKYSLKNILSGALVTLCLVSCDPLGIEPTTVVDEPRFWENAQLSRSYVNEFYTYAPTTAGTTFQSEQWSDNSIGYVDGQYNGYRQTNFTHRRYDAVTGLGDVFDTNALWNNSYKKIRAANLGLERIGSSTFIKEDDKKQMLAECYFFRAWFFFELEQYWGTVPYVDKVLTVFDETMIPRATRQDLFDKILGDLDQSVTLFNESANKGVIGMINANVATAIKSRVALYAGCAAEASAKGIYGTDETGKLFTFTKPASDYYRIAFNAASSLIGKYSLETNYEDLFTSETSYKSTESIWPMMFNKTGRPGFNPTGSVGPQGIYYGATKANSFSWATGGAGFGVFPTEDLASCYYQQDSKDGVWKQWWKTQQARDMNLTNDGEGNFTGTSADYRNLLYGNRDERFYSTIAYDGSYLSKENNQKEMYIIQTWTDNTIEPNKNMQYSALHSGYRQSANLDNPQGRTLSITGYYLRKYSYFDKYNEDGTLNREQRTTCYFMTRYAEVLLNYAEAAIKLGEGDAEGKINEIRQRAGLDKFNATTTGHDLWHEYQLQRRVEFAFEVPGQRYYDLLRWNEAAGKSSIEELNQGPELMRIFRKGIESLEPGENGYPVEVGGLGYFTPSIVTVRSDYPDFEKKFDHSRYYFLPFSESMLTSYKGLTQNPGWTGFYH